VYEKVPWVYDDTVSLNVKNPETTRLVMALAERLRTTQVAAITDAVSARLAELDRPTRSVENLLGAIWADQDEAERRAVRDRVGSLYDEMGLPA